MVIFNFTDSVHNKYYSPALHVMRAVDEAILQIKTNSNNSKIEVDTKDFPTPKPKISSYGTIRQE